MKTKNQEVEVRIVDSLTFSLYLHLWEINEGDKVPQCMFLKSTRDNGKVVAADNSSGHFFVEEFESYEEAIDWILGDDIEDIWARRTKFKRGDKVRIVKDYMGRTETRGVDTIGKTGIVLESDTDDASRVFLEDLRIDFWYENDAIELIKDEEEENG